jgi:hypothetical protein
LAAPRTLLKKKRGVIHGSGEVDQQDARKLLNTNTIASTSSLLFSKKGTNPGLLRGGGSQDAVNSPDARKLLAPQNLPLATSRSLKKQPSIFSARDVAMGRRDGKSNSD